MTNDSTPAPLVDMGAEMVRSALAELVACKDLKDSIAAATNVIQAHVRDGEYRQRQPLAWDSARKALATAPAAAPIEAEPRLRRAIDAAIQSLTDAARRTSDSAERVQYGSSALLLQILATPPQATAPEVPQEAVAARPFEFEGNRRAVAAVMETVGTLLPCPMDRWVDYAKRGGLLDENGIATDRVKAQTAFYAFSAAWNESHRAVVEALATPAKLEGEPVAHVPIHPRNGPLWMDTLPAGSQLHRSASYPMMALYATPQPRRSPLTDAEIDKAIGIESGRNASLEMVLRSVFRTAETAHGILAADSMEAK